MPALLNSKLTGPRSASTLSAAAANAARSIASSRTPIASRLSRLASAASIASCRMSAMATLQPSLSKLRTMPSPTPLAPPVTNAVRPAKSFMSASRRRHRIERADRVLRPAFPPRQELVHDPPLAEQPSSIDLAQLVLVDPEGAHLQALARPIVRHLEPLRAGPGAVALDTDRRMSQHVAQHRRVAVLVLVVFADPLLEALHRLEDVGFAADSPAREFELGIVGEHLDKTVEIVVVEREQIARHQVLDLGAVTRVTVVIVLRCHDYWTLLKGGLSRACRCDRLRQLLCFAAHYSPPRKPGKPKLRQDPVSNGAARGEQAMAIAPT